jgi:SAM-dependent methyltransferase
MQIKKLVGMLDRAILGGALTRIYLSTITSNSVKHKTHQLNYGFDVQYQKNDSSLLNILADKYGSDKGEVSPDQNPYKWASHNYADFYSIVFGLRRNDVKNVIECGLGTNNPTIESSMGIDGKPGASLRMWRDYFPSAHIVGCDIDSDILFEEERIKTFYCDQTSSEAINNFLKNAEIIKDSVDIIIDDGLHEYHAGICFFENMIECLRSDGIYIIEDVIHLDDMVKYKNYFCENSASFDAKFIYLKSPLLNWGDDNNLIFITRK